jgi:hypothetical protein
MSTDLVRDEGDLSGDSGYRVSVEKISRLTWLLMGRWVDCYRIRARAQDSLGCLSILTLALSSWTNENLAAQSRRDQWGLRFCRNTELRHPTCGGGVLAEGIGVCGMCDGAKKLHYQLGLWPTTLVCLIMYCLYLSSSHEEHWPGPCLRWREKIWQNWPWLSCWLTPFSEQRRPGNMEQFRLTQSQEW